MANTCTTDYVFEGECAQIRALHKALDTLQKAEPEKKREGSYAESSNWLGYIVKKMLGEDPARTSCRGEFNLQEIDNCPYDEDKLILNVSTTTAWSPCNEIFEKLAEKYDCSLYWIAEEFGFGLFQSNDSEEKYFGDDNIVIEVDGHGLEYFSSEEDAVAYVVGMTGNPNITFDELEDLDDVFVTKLEYVS